MSMLCRNAISVAKNARVFGLVLGTLGRQGSMHIFNRIKALLNGHPIGGCAATTTGCSCGSNQGSCSCCSGSEDCGRCTDALSLNHPLPKQTGGRVVIPFMMAELNPKKMASISAIEVWIQVACPRLSIDWGAQSELMNKPLLTPYELEIMLQSSVNQVDSKDHRPLRAPSDSKAAKPIPIVPTTEEAFREMSYKMDFYSDDAGPWGNMYHRHAK